MINHQVVFDLAGIQLPVGDRPAVRAPAESVATKKLFFISPVEAAVDQFTVAARGKRFDRTRCQVFYIQIILTDIGRFFPVGRYFGEHQRSGGPALAQLFQGVVCLVQDPIIAPGFVSPYLFRISVKDGQAFSFEDVEIF